MYFQRKEKWTSGYIASGRKHNGPTNMGREQENMTSDRKISVSNRKWKESENIMTYR